MIMRIDVIENSEPTFYRNCLLSVEVECQEFAIEVAVRSDKQIQFLVERARYYLAG